MLEARRETRDENALANNGAKLTKGRRATLFVGVLR